MTGPKHPETTSSGAPAPIAGSRFGGHRRIRRRLQPLPDPLSQVEPRESSSLVVTFKDTRGEPADSYDFGKLGLATDVATLFADAFHHAFQHRSRASRKINWSALINFSRFAHETRPPVKSLQDFKTSIVSRYFDWLSAQTSTRSGRPLSQSSIANQLNALRQTLRAASRLPGRRLPNDVVFPSYLVPDRVAPLPIPHLDKTLLETLLVHCYLEIDEAMHRFHCGQELLSSPHPAPKQDPVLHRLVHVIAASTSSGVSPYQALRSEGLSGHTIGKYGRTQILQSYAFATVDTLAPFYLALLIQTAANPEPFRKILRNCIQPHPIEDSQKIVSWLKPRAGRQREKIQRRSFDIRKKRAAPNLIAQLHKLTQPLLPLQSSKDAVPLFLVRCRRTNRIKIPTEKMLDTAIRKFCRRTNQRIEQWNRQNPDAQKTLIPSFTLRQLRPSVAAIHYEATGADIRYVGRILNHAHPSTTVRYVDSPRNQRFLEGVIADIQTEFVRHVLDVSAVTATCKHRPRRAPMPKPASASIGHDCANPFLTPQTLGRDTQPRLCPHFHHCLLNCPGLVVPLDAIHLARLMLFREVLDAGHARIDPDRWRILYAPVSSTVDEILSRFPDALFSEARELLRTLPPLPELE